MKIYTRSGDKGKTRLIGNVVKSKSDKIFEALGTLDELNSSLGVVIAWNSLPTQTRNFIQKTQNTLFDLGALIANPKSVKKDFGWLEDLTLELEKKMDDMDKKLPPLKSFILPGGSKEAALIHTSRSICRRAERRLVATVKVKEATKYVNRLSDFLFVLARFMNYKTNKKDILWTPRS